MSYCRGNISRSRNSWGPMSVSSDFHRSSMHPDYNEEFAQRMLSAEMRQLDPLKEDLAEWLNKTLGICFLTGENLLGELDNGVILCHLANVIHDQAVKLFDAGLSKSPPPKVQGKCFEKAMRRSFFSRDNMENFIKFCKSLGVHQNLLFESDDLVLHNKPRNVILCLLEVTRLAHNKYYIEPPGLVQLEKEIAEEERNHSADSGIGSLLSWQFQESPPRIITSRMRLSNSSSALLSHSFGGWDPSSLHLPDRGGGGEGNALPSLPPIGGASDGVPSDNTEDEWSRGSGEDPDAEIEPPTTPTVTTPTPVNTPSGGGGDVLTELDRRVQQAARLMQKNCNCANGKCSKLNVSKVGEGKYNIAGRNVFVRLLKGRHTMVRVGGGWDTLDHFLLRHDPCQVKVITRSSEDSPSRPASAASAAPKYLHIRAKYCSPPPNDSVKR